MNAIIRAYEAKLDFDEAERSVVATINTDAIDRYNTVIIPSGARLENYRKNPVVLANHGGGMFGGEAEAALPVGRNLWIKVQKNRMVAKTQFLPPGISELADKVCEMYRLGFLNCWSIGMLPAEYGRPTPEEIRARPELAGVETIFRAWELVEYSCVTTPGNPEAARAAIARGLALPGWEPRGTPAPAEAPPPALPPLVGRTLGQVGEAIRRRVRAEAGEMTRRAIVDAQELARGMV